MSKVLPAVRQRIADAINANIGNRLTPELAIGLHAVIDDGFKRVVEELSAPSTELVAGVNVEQAGANES